MIEITYDRISPDAQNYVKTSTTSFKLKTKNKKITWAGCPKEIEVENIEEFNFKENILFLKTKNNRISFRAETLPEVDRLEKIMLYIGQFKKQGQRLGEVNRFVSIELNTELIKDIDEAKKQLGLGSRSETVQQILVMAMTQEPQEVEQEIIKLTIKFSRSLLGKIDDVRKDWRLKSRRETVERILLEFFEEGAKVGMDDHFKTSEEPLGADK